MALEAHSRVRQTVEHRAGVALVAVAAEALGAQRVDHDEQHVQVAAVPQPRDVLGGPARAAIPVARQLNLDERRQEGDHDDARSDEPGPTLLEQLLRTARKLAQRPWFRLGVVVYIRAMRPVIRATPPRIPRRCALAQGCSPASRSPAAARSIPSKPSASNRRPGTSRDPSSRCGSCWRRARMTRKRTSSTGGRSRSPSGRTSRCGRSARR